MTSDPSLLSMFIIGLDVLIAGMLIFFLYRNERLRGRISAADIQTLQQLEISLKKSIVESSSSSQQLLQEFDQKLAGVKQVFVDLAGREAELRNFIDRAESAVRRLQQDKPENQKSSGDAYKAAAGLLAGGCSAEHVHKACGISYAEIDLISHIVKSTAG